MRSHEGELKSVLKKEIIITIVITLDCVGWGEWNVIYEMNMK